MTISYGDSNEEDKEAFHRGLEGASRPEVSTRLKQYHDSLAASNSVHPMDSAIVDPLCDAADAFRLDVSRAVERMEKKFLEEQSEEKMSWGGSTAISLESPLIYVVLMRSDWMGHWFLAPYDPNKLLDLFPSLHLQAGYHLESFQLLSGGNGSGFVFAMPAKRTLSKVLPRQALQHLLFTGMDIFDSDSRLAYPIYQVYRLGMGIMGAIFPGYRLMPRWARRDVESFLGGDGSSLSYFQASIFMRSLGELGGRWHDVSWGNHKIVSKLETLPDEEWTWYESEPSDWRPQVWKDADHRWNVSFYTVNRINAELRFHNDTFGSGYGFETFSAAIADYPGACMV